MLSLRTKRDQTSARLKWPYSQPQRVAKRSTTQLLLQATWDREKAEAKATETSKKKLRELPNSGIGSNTHRSDWQKKPKPDRYGVEGVTGHTVCNKEYRT